MNLERTSLVLFTSSIVSKILGFVGSIYFARELGPEIIGIFALVQAVVGMLGVPADFGVQGAVEKRISEASDRNEQDRFFTASIVILSAAFVIVLMFIIIIRPFLIQYIGENLVIELSIILFLTILYQLFTAVLRAEFKIEQTAGISVVKNITRITVSVGLILLGYGIYALITGLMLGILVGIGLSIFTLDLKIVRPRREHFRSLYEFSKYNVILRSSGLAYTWIDTLMIGYFLTQSLVGVYEVAWSLTGIIILASRAVSQTLFPNFSQFISNDNIEKLERILPKSILYSLLIPIPAFFGIVLISKDILSILYGPEFSSGWLVFIILAGERIAHSVHSIIYRTLLAFDKPDIAFRISGTTMILNGILNAVLIPWVGIVGAASAFIISYSINLYIYYYYLSNIISIEFPVRDVSWVLISSIIMASLVYLITNVFEIDTVTNLMLLIVVAVISYLLLLLKSQSIRGNITDLIS